MNTDALIAQLVGLAETVEHCDHATDPAERATLARKVAVEAGQVAQTVAAVRDNAAATMADTGMSLAQIGQALGMSRQRAGQLVTRARSRAAKAWDGQHVVPLARRDLRAEFADYCEAEYLLAERETRGYLMTRAGMRAHIDGRGFYTAHGRRLPVRWASEELQDHWEAHGRPLTWAQWQQGLGRRAELRETA